MSVGRSSPLILSFAVVVIWCAVTGRWSVDAWQTPFSWRGDPLEIYARVQAASEDLTQPLLGYSHLSRLGAPFHADWTLYPVSDRLVFTAVGCLARLVGIFAAVNIAIAATHVLNALAFYACGRWLCWRREWAVAMALLFTFANFNFRWGITLSLSLTFFVPPLLLLCGWVGRDAPGARARGWRWLAAGLGFWLGGANPYFGFFCGMLLGFALLLQWLRRRDTARLQTGGLFLAILLASFVLHNAPYLVRLVAGGEREPLVRTFAGAEIYGLKLIDLLIPPARHQVEAFREIGRFYQHASALRGEFFYNYLGIVALLGLAVAAGGWLVRFVRRPRVRLPDAVLGVCWTVVFSTVGGLNSLLALAGLDFFRATNRYSVFLLAWALFFAGGWCQRRGRHWHRGLTVLLAAALAAAGLFDSTLDSNPANALASIGRDLQGDRQIVQSIEHRTGPGARMYQLPWASFPEAGAINRMGDYEHFRPYLVSGAQRFSYGGLRNGLADRWNRTVASLPTAKLVAEIESAGFGVLWIDRRGLPRQQARQMIEELRSMGREELPTPTTSPITVFLLHPSPHPVVIGPDDPRLLWPWDEPWIPGASLVVANLGGWYDLEKTESHARRWARHRAAIGVWLQSGPRSVRISFRASSLRKGLLELTGNGRTAWKMWIGSEPTEVTDMTVVFRQGLNRLDWNFYGHTLCPEGDARRLGFSIEDFRVEADADPAAGSGPDR